MINGLAPLDEKIQEKYDAYLKAKEELVETIEAAQAECSHSQVFHAEYKSQDYGYGIKPRRMCVICRLEEEGSIWSGMNSWSPREYGKGELDNEPHRLVIKVEKHDEIYKMRLPTPPEKFLWSANKDRKE